MALASISLALAICRRAISRLMAHLAHSIVSRRVWAMTRCLVARVMMCSQPAMGRTPLMVARVPSTQSIIPISMQQISTSRLLLQVRRPLTRSRLALLLLGIRSPILRPLSAHPAMTAWICVGQPAICRLWVEMAATCSSADRAMIPLMVAAAMNVTPLHMRISQAARRLRAVAQALPPRGRQRARIC